MPNRTLKDQIDQVRSRLVSTQLQRERVRLQFPEPFEKPSEVEISMQSFPPVNPSPVVTASASDNALDVEITLGSPEAGVSRRLNVHIALVVDTSYSMADLAVAKDASGKEQVTLRLS